MNNKKDLIDLLESYYNKWKFSPEEESFINDTKNFVLKNENYKFRTNLKWHITNSAWVLDESFNHALLIHHRKLDKWFQPWWHCEEYDLTIQDGSLREVLEETWVKKVNLKNLEIFDIDVHKIPEKWNEPEHIHYDIRFLCISNDFNLDNLDLNEVKNARWISLNELEKTQQSPAIKRMILKSRELSLSSC